MKLENVILEYAHKNPDIIGEALRNYCFVGPGFGCYESFELRPEFIRMPSNGELSKQIIPYLETDETDKINIYISVVKDDAIIVAWFWDGDGTLVFICNNQVFRNNDCKKDHGWEIVDEY